MKKKKTVPLSPLDKILQGHKKTCTYYVFSGDRHCSCGRTEAIEQYKFLLKMAFLYVKYSSG